MKKGYIIGLVVAAAAGVIAGMLLAPEKGKDLRKKIADKGVELGNKVKDTIQKNRNHMTELKKEILEV